MDLKFKNKVIMVAGSSEGLGYGIAKCLAEEGCHLSLASRSIDKITSAVDQLKAINHTANIRGYIMNASDSESIKAWATETLKDFQRIDGLVINAGGPPFGNFDTFNIDDWQHAFELTLMSAVHMIHAVLPTMRQQKQGAILAITSYMVKEPYENLILSNVFRSGLVALLKSLSRQLAKENIRVNNLVPGIIDTARVERLDHNEAERNHISVIELKQYRTANIPMGRYGHIEEFGRAGAFLLSDAASYITGETLIVDGGLVKTVW